MHLKLDCRQVRAHNQCMMAHRAQKALLSEVAEISAGHPLRSGVDGFPLGDVGVIQMRNVDPETGVDWGNVSRIELPPARRTEFLTSQDVIFSPRGVRTYAVPLDPPPFQTVCSPQFFVLRPRGTELDPRFLAWQINQAPTQEYLQREATGSHILNIRREVIERLEIVIPSRAQQAAIVAFADAAAHEKRLLTGLIENRQQQMNALAARLRAYDEE